MKKEVEWVFTVMEGFMDSVDVKNNTKGGVSVKLTKKIKSLKETKVG